MKPELGAPIKPKIDKGKVKPRIDKGEAPVEKPSKSVKQVDGGGIQKSQHPNKDQSRIMRYLKR